MKLIEAWKDKVLQWRMISVRFDNTYSHNKITKLWDLIFLSIQLDKKRRVCYHTSMILTLSVLSCVKGALYGFHAPAFLGRSFHCRADEDTAIFIWEERSWKHG